MAPNDPNTPQPGDAASIPSQAANQLPVVTDYSQANQIGTHLGGLGWPDLQDSGEGVNVMGFLHSLRRRWLSGAAVGLLLATIVAGALWLLIPVSFEAVALLRVRRDPSNIYGPQAVGSDSEFETFKSTQETLITSPFVMTTALRKPGISQLPLVSQEENQVAWLSRELKVTNPANSEILRLSMKGQFPEQLKRLVKAATEAFLAEVVYAERDEKVRRLNTLKQNYSKINLEIRQKFLVFQTLAESLGAEDSLAAKRIQMAEISQLNALAREREEAQRRLEDTIMQISLFNTARGFQAYRPSKYEIEDGMLSYPLYAYASQEFEAIREVYLSQSQAVRQGSSALAPLQGQLRAAQAKLDRIQRELTPRVLDRLRRFHKVDENQDEQKLILMETHRRLLQQKYNRVDQAYEDQLDKVTKLGPASADLESRRRDLNGLEDHTKSMRREIASLDVNLQSPHRIQVIQEADVPDAQNDLMFKILEIAGAWVVTFAMTILGIAFWDYQGKRVNSSKDISASTGISVLGSLPQLNGRRVGGLWPFPRMDQSSLEVVLNYSIDSIRTALLYNKAKWPLKIVMVTSSRGQEGKTTVASQLAVSLAKSGQRTLLVDCDLRNPQQHLVFGMPFDRGFCELLREEADSNDVLQATSVEGLWMIQAGYYDQMSFKALSNDSIRNVLKELKSQFDFVILDSGPVLTGAEPLLIGQHSDATILSVRRDVSQLPKIAAACERLRSVGVHIIGSVVNGAGAEIRRGELNLTASTAGDDDDVDHQESN